jgi:hypothetical protein
MSDLLYNSGGFVQSTVVRNIMKENIPMKTDLSGGSSSTPSIDGLVPSETTLAPDKLPLSIRETTGN